MPYCDSTLVGSVATGRISALVVLSNAKDIFSSDENVPRIFNHKSLEC